jgi:hypothetical protein
MGLRAWWARVRRERNEAGERARLARSAQQAVPLRDVTPEGRLLVAGGPTKAVLRPRMEPFGSMSATELEGALSRLAAAFNGIPYPHRVKWVAVGRAGGWERSLAARREAVAALTGPERRLALASLDQLQRQIETGAVRMHDTYIVAEEDDPQKLSRIVDYLRRAFNAEPVRGQEALAAEVLAWRGVYLPQTGGWYVGSQRAGGPEMVIVGGKATVRPRPPDPVVATDAPRLPPKTTNGTSLARPGDGRRS